MRLGQASIYGIVATLHIANHEKEGQVDGARIAKECGIPGGYLHKILLQLVRVRILVSKRGRGGGFGLMKSPRQTTLLEIVEAIEGPVDGDLIFRGKIGIPRRATKRFTATRRDILARTKQRLAKTNIKQLMD